MTGTLFIDLWCRPLELLKQEAERLRNWNRSETSGRNSFHVAESALAMHIRRQQEDIAELCNAWFDDSAFRVEEHRWVA